MTILITADELAALDAPRVLDVRWTLPKPDGSDDFRAGHVPGAVYVSLDDELAAHGEPTDGRHPLPTVEALQESARRWGIDDGDTVVVYDAGGNLASARAWWLLRHAGVEDVRLLDGGLDAWTASGRELETGDVSPDRGGVTLSYGHLPVVGIDDVLAVAADGALLDARAPERSTPPPATTWAPTGDSSTRKGCAPRSSRPASTPAVPSRPTAAPASRPPTTSSP
jgi:thiosulfate/3-mercaptopyruvate sulfurtransferase